MPHVALWEPEIPPNTGNIARLCAATGAALHLIGRLGFQLDDRSLLRAGLDYWSAVDIIRHASLAEWEAWVERQAPPPRILCFSTRGDKLYTACAFQHDDVLLFGNESFGLPQEVLQQHAERTFSVPMPTGKVRSLNLASAVGIVLYEALRQLHHW